MGFSFAWFDYFILILLFVVVSMLITELRVSHMLGKHSVTKLQTYFALFPGFLVLF